VTALLVVWLAVTGLAVGSFLNVVVYRVPRGLSVVSPPSACPQCGHGIRARDNVPVFSWLLLRGRCRDCATPISARYPLVEAGTAALFAAVGLRFGLTAMLPALLFLAATGFALALIDIDVQRLPFAITVPATGVVVALLAIAGFADGWGPAGVAALSAAVWLAVYGGIWLGTTGRGMGLGDVVLAPMLGLTLGWLGWGASLVGLLGGFACGALIGVALFASGRVQRRQKVPFGPFMLGGAALGIFVGPSLWSAYLGAMM
jgi:leader peptidase (prepilin peptidase)/N-methyltransferase